MPTLCFEENELGPAIATEVAKGGRLLDACDDVDAPVDFSCRAASCGICRVEVLAGGDLLAPPTEDEREGLAIFATSPAQRLACQTIVLPGPGLIRLRWVSDSP